MLIVLIFLGLSFGSFVNALVWRIHEQQGSKPKTNSLKLSIVHGRSMCTHCKHELAWYDLLPVVSWLSLGGKCRYCHEKIDDSPLVELILAGLFALSYLIWPYGYSLSGKILFVSWLITLVGLLALAVYDMKWMLLPNRLTVPLTGFWVLLTLVLLGINHDPNLLIRAIGGVVFCGGIFWVLFQISKGKWIGGGDVKLGFLLGLIVASPVKSLTLIFGASLLGLIYAFPLQIRGKLNKNSKIPFGPFLILSAVIVFLVGNTIIKTYITYLYPVG